MIEVLIGNIASGKSTWSQKRAKDGAIILNDDSFVLAFHGGNYAGYRPENKDLYKGVEDAAIHLALAKGLDVVIDRPCVTPCTRAHYVTLARRLDRPIVAVLFDRATPEEHARRRAKHDARGRDYAYWLRVTQHHDNIYQSPDFMEGFDNIVPQDVAAMMHDNGVWCNAATLRQEKPN
jgi:predicted kinase